MKNLSWKGEKGKKVKRENKKLEKKNDFFLLVVDKNGVFQSHIGRSFGKADTCESMIKEGK